MMVHISYIVLLLTGSPIEEFLTPADCTILEQGVEELQKLMDEKKIVSLITEPEAVSVHNSIKRPAFICAQVERTACDDSTEEIKMDFKSKKVLFL